MAMANAGFTLPSFAKINWELHILGKRRDGFHELCTAFQTISLADAISFQEEEELTLTCSEPNIPADSSNLIIRAAGELRRIFGARKGAKIHLEKLIPSPGGLGGGSSNAAVALVGLSRLWFGSADIDALIDIGKELGSDVPFFFHGGTAIGTGRGEIIGPAPDVSELFMLVVTPDVSVPTADVYRALNAPSLTTTGPNRILQICRSTPDLRSAALKNDLEPLVTAAFPEIARVKKKLLDLGATWAMLSGSGASVYAVFDNKETRQAALKALDIESTWRKFAVATISRSEYREALQLVY